MPELGDAPIEPVYVDMMNGVAKALDETFNGRKTGEERKVGFVLMMFNFGDTGRCNYISNAKRADVVTLLKEQLARFQGQPDITGHA